MIEHNGSGGKKKCDFTKNESRANVQKARTGSEGKKNTDPYNCTPDGLGLFSPRRPNSCRTAPRPLCMQQQNGTLMPVVAVTQIKLPTVLPKKYRLICI